MTELNDKSIQFIDNCERECQDKFNEITRIEYVNQLKVLNAFQKNNVQSFHFVGSTGYGHDDIGKEVLSNVFRDIFHTEDAFASALIASGTEVITQAFFGLLRPNDNMLAISGMPYDSLKSVLVGVEGEDIGSLKDFNIGFDYVELKNNDFDDEEILRRLQAKQPKVVYIQRSRGYEVRDSLSISKIERIIKLVKSNSNAIVLVDNCYGELTETREPTDVGADVVVGSLIKNLGGGVAPTGGYVAGRKELVEKISYRITSPATGVDIGSYTPGYRLFFEGLFLAPHTVAESLKVVALTSVAMSRVGYRVLPKLTDTFSDNVCCIVFNDDKKLIDFTNKIQSSSPVDSNLTSEPFNLEGYEDTLIMASGSFNQGSTSELSCDGPIRPPFACYLQGSLTYQHGKIALTKAIEDFI